MNSMTHNTTHTLSHRRSSCPRRTWPFVRPLAIDTISIDAPVRVNEALRAFGVCLSAVQRAKRCPCDWLHTGCYPSSHLPWPSVVIDRNVREVPLGNEL